MECNSCGGDIYDPVPCAECGSTFCENCGTMIMCACGKQICNGCIGDHYC